MVTLHYRPIEILLGVGNYTTAVDIWSCGVLMAELLIGESPWKADSELYLLLEILHGIEYPSSCEWPAFEQIFPFIDNINQSLNHNLRLDSSNENSKLNISDSNNENRLLNKIKVHRRKYHNDDFDENVENFLKGYVYFLCKSVY